MSPETKRLGLKLRSERKAQGLTVFGMAEALRDSAPERERRDLPKLADLQRKIRDWENGKWAPNERYRLLYCRALGLSEDDLFGEFLRAREEAKRARATVRRARTGGAGETDETSQREEADEVERRRMLQALAALGVGSMSPVADAVQTIRGYVEKNLAREPSTQMEEWEQAVADHGYGYLALPPAQLVGELAADIVDVQTFTPGIREGHPLYSRWCRVTSGLAWLMAKTLCNLGHVQESRGWWTTAQHAADASGDKDLGLWVSGERLIRGLYERRPAAVLLRQATAATLGQPQHPCAGLVHIYTLQAQVYALIGRASEATQRLRDAEAVFNQLPAEVIRDTGSTWYWGEDRLRYTEAWVHAHLGDTAQLDVAAGRVVELAKHADPRSTMQIKLVQAFGHVRAGDVTEGIKLATSTYEAWPAEQRTTIIGRLAEEVWEEVPSDQRHISSAVAYRELVASSPSRRAIT